MGLQICGKLFLFRIFRFVHKLVYTATDRFHKIVTGRETACVASNDGYRRLFSIVIDLAFRCALLNSHTLGAEAALKTHGTVIIDEIDLHLHPSLQAVVTKALCRTFPNLHTEARVLLQQMRDRFGDRIPELNGIETQITIFDDNQDNDSD